MRCVADGVLGYVAAQTTQHIGAPPQRNIT